MLKEIKTFLHVAKCGSFSYASQQIGLTQAAVSMQIKVLEKDLGIQLFERNARSIRLSKSGEKILPFAEQMVHLYTMMGSPYLNENLKGELRVGAISSVMAGFLSRAVSIIHREVPEMKLRFVPGVSMDLIGMLEKNELDIVITAKPPFEMPKSFDISNICSEEFVLIVPKGSFFSSPYDALLTQPFIHYYRQNYGGMLVCKFLKEKGIVPNYYFEVNEIDAILNLVENGVGIAIIPLTEIVIKKIDSIEILRFNEPDFTRDIVLLQHYHRRNDDINKMFLSAVKESGSKCNLQGVPA